MPSSNYCTEVYLYLIGNMIYLDSNTRWNDFKCGQSDLKLASDRQLNANARCLKWQAWKSLLYKTWTPSKPLSDKFVQNCIDSGGLYNTYFIRNVYPTGKSFVNQFSVSSSSTLGGLKTLPSTNYLYKFWLGIDVKFGLYQTTLGKITRNLPIHQLRCFAYNNIMRYM